MKIKRPNPLITLRKFSGKVRSIISQYNSLEFTDYYYNSRKNNSSLNRFKKYLNSCGCEYIGQGCCASVYRINKNWVIKLTHVEPDEKIDFEVYNIGWELHYLSWSQLSSFTKEQKSLFRKAQADTLKCIVPVSYISRNNKMCIQEYIEEKPGYEDYIKAMEIKYKFFHSNKMDYILPFVDMYDKNVVFDGVIPRLIDLL